MLLEPALRRGHLSGIDTHLFVFPSKAHRSGSHSGRQRRPIMRAVLSEARRCVPMATYTGAGGREAVCSGAQCRASRAQCHASTAAQGSDRDGPFNHVWVAAQANHVWIVLRRDDADRRSR